MTLFSHKITFLGIENLNLNSQDVRFSVRLQDNHGWPNLSPFCIHAIIQKKILFPQTYIGAIKQACSIFELSLNTKNLRPLFLNVSIRYAPFGSNSELVTNWESVTISTV